MYVLLFTDDLEPNSLAVIPGMGIPEQLKLAMEQEQMGKRGDAHTHFMLYKMCRYLFLIFMINYVEKPELFMWRSTDRSDLKYLQISCLEK